MSKRKSDSIKVPKVLFQHDYMGKKYSGPTALMKARQLLNANKDLGQKRREKSLEVEGLKVKTQKIIIQD